MIKRQLALQANAEASAPPASSSSSSASSSTTVVAANGKAKNKGKVTGKKDSSDSTSVFSSPRPSYTNKQRVLIIASRGINARFRHLLEDLKKLIPHHKKDNKLDTKGNIHAVNEIAEVNSCNQIMYLECRKRQDLYMHLARTPQGPSVKFHVVNIHTMDELKLTGNCMIGSRPLLNFDNKFNTNPHMRLLKTLLTDAFGTPNGHPKSKPFVDRVMCFFVVKNNIWVRNYQMLDKTDQDKKGDTNTSLIEIGPRMVLIPIRIFSGSLGGATLYQNGAFVSPNDERSMQKKRKGDLYSNRVEHKKLRSEIQVAIQPPPDLMSSKNVFK